MSNTKRKNYFQIDPIFQQYEENGNNSKEQQKIKLQKVDKQSPQRPKYKVPETKKQIQRNRQNYGEKQIPNTEKILADKVDKVMKQKFTFLIQVYLNNAYQNGYNSKLAFRVISLYLFCDFKNNEQDMIKFNLNEQVNRFLNAQIGKGQLSNLQRAMDLLMIKQLNDRMADKYIKYWRIKVLNGLKRYYAINHMKKQKKKASLAMRQLCKQQLKKQSVKNEPQMYTTIMDILLEEQKIILASKKSHGKIFQAIQNANNIIRILQKAEQVIIPKYQEQLMLGYWEVAKLHNQLHYVTYARKYCQTTINIADRINDKKIGAMARAMLESLHQG